MCNGDNPKTVIMFNHGEYFGRLILLEVIMMQEIM